MPKKRSNRAILKILQQRWPKCFQALPNGDHQPLKVGIHEDLLAVPDLEIYPSDLRRFLGHYVRKPPYLLGAHVGMARVDLDGNPRGTLSADDVHHFQYWCQRVRDRRNRETWCKRALNVKSAWPPRLQLPRLPPLLRLPNPNAYPCKGSSKPLWSVGPPPAKDSVGQSEFHTPFVQTGCCGGKLLSHAQISPRQFSGELARRFSNQVNESI
jgi:hypothetical protein